MGTSSSIRKKLLAGVTGCIALALLFGGIGAAAGGECKNRGDLDVRYCDNNGDLLADTPKDSNQWLDPGTLIFNLYSHVLAFLNRMDPLGPGINVFRANMDHAPIRRGLAGVGDQGAQGLGHLSLIHFNRPEFFLDVLFTLCR